MKNRNNLTSATVKAPKVEQKTKRYSTKNPLILELVILLFVGALLSDTHAGNSADSVHLWYQEGESSGGGNMIAMDARVEVTQLYTYYCALGWNTGYMGLQRGGGGYFKHVHFSIWDSPDGSQVEVIWKADDVVSERFGGEGTGYKSMYPFTWNENVTYRFCVKLENVAGKTDYKAYFYAPEVGAWKHLITIRRNDGPHVFGYVYSFVEDFIGTVDNRRACLFGNGWMRTTSGNWVEQRTALFTNYQHPYSTLNHDADVVGKMFRLETGGNTVRDTSINSLLQADAQGTPPHIVPSIPTWVSATDGSHKDRVRVSWNSSTGATSYEVWRHTSNSSNFATKVGEAISSPYDDTTALDGNTYYYWVKAKNVIDSSGFSPSDSGYRISTPSANADLSALTLSSGILSPIYASATIAYTSSVAYATPSITVTPTRSQANATISLRLNGGTYADVTSGSPSGALALNVGGNTVDVRVTAQDGITQRTYTIAVTRLAAPPVVFPSATDITSTGATLGGNVTSDGGATITERGVVYSATTTNSNPLIGGTGVTKVTATGTTGTTGVLTALITGLTPGTSYRFKAYAINSQGTAYSSVASFLTLSNEANLGGLVLDGFGLSPSFAAATTSYAATVQRSDGTVRIRPTSAHLGASLFARVNGGGWVPVSSGSLSLPLALEFGDNLLEVRVIAQDGATERLYSLEVFRNQARPDAMVGRSVAFMGGANVYGSASAQRLTLVATRARAVSGYVAVANRGNRPDSIALRGSRGTRLFRVDYRSSSNRLVSGAVLAGTYRTPVLAPGGAIDWLRVNITPQRNLLVLKRGSRTAVLRRVHTTSVQARSGIDTSAGDGVCIRVKTR